MKEVTFNFIKPNRMKDHTVEMETQMGEMVEATKDREGQKDIKIEVGQDLFPFRKEMKSQ